MALLGKALAEMVGTFTIIFVGGSSILLSEKYPAFVPSFWVAVTFGTVVTLMILAIGHFSGAHFNPAVSLAFVLTKRFPVSQLAVYWLSQCAGGAVAAVLLIVLRRMS